VKRGVEVAEEQMGEKVANAQLWYVAKNPDPNPNSKYCSYMILTWVWLW
jgi:hypothetical protein